LSRFQLVRSFSRNTGFTPHAFLLHRRILLARRLIAGGMALADAAAASGFADQSHMTRVFTRKYGVSPGAFAISFKT
jgi:AraC-like DNA-binding protein